MTKTTETTERPIIFNEWSLKRLLAGEKTRAFPTAPWEATIEPPRDTIVDGEAAIWDSKGDLVCAVDTEMASNGEMEIAIDRARLIAAAPEMKAALERVVQPGHTDTCDAVLGDYDCTCGWQDAKAALDKATGETHPDE